MEAFAVLKKVHFCVHDLTKILSDIHYNLTYNNDRYTDYCNMIKLRSMSDEKGS